MTNESIYATLTDILRSIFDDDTLVAEPALTAAQVDGWDSFAHLRFILAVEQRFGVSFAASQISSFKNVGELAALIATKTQAPGS